MTLEQYLSARRERELRTFRPRKNCPACKKSKATCYCPALKPFESKATFVILMHPDEVRRSIATGRMAHLCLSNSLLFEGVDFSSHHEVNKLIENPSNFCVLLSPGPQSVDLSQIKKDERKSLVPLNRKLVVFLLDATWSQAKRMRRLSQNIQSLERFCFTPEVLSQFYVRKQPDPKFYSTIEAIHAFLDLMELETNAVHGSLLEVFRYMVNQQIEYENQFGSPRGFRPIRGVRESANIGCLKS